MGLNTSESFEQTLRILYIQTHILAFFRLSIRLFFITFICELPRFTDEHFLHETSVPVLVHPRGIKYSSLRDTTTTGYLLLHLSHRTYVLAMLIVLLPRKPGYLFQLVLMLWLCQYLFRFQCNQASLA